MKVASANEVARQKRRSHAGSLTPRTLSPAFDASSIPGARKMDISTARLEPMLATLTERPFEDSDWVFEPKLDGMRVIAVVSSGGCRMYSRRGQDATYLFPSLSAELESTIPHDAILDGEIVAQGASGAPSFQRLQRRINLSREADILLAENNIPVLYYVFDILYLDGFSLLGATFEDRRTLLYGLLPSGGRVRMVEQLGHDGRLAFEACLQHGFEGVVAKRRDSRYEIGRRSRNWLKVKGTLSDDFVIGGYTRGTGWRAASFGSLLIGQFDNEERLQFAGHVGTGFDSATIPAVLKRLDAIRTDQCPFGNRPAVNAEVTWVRPELVAEVKFMHRTQDGRLRAPVFIHLHDDKPAREAHPASVVPAPRDKQIGSPAERGSALPHSRADTEQIEDG